MGITLFMVVSGNNLWITLLQTNSVIITILTYHPGPEFYHSYGRYIMKVR